MNNKCKARRKLNTRICKRSRVRISFEHTIPIVTLLWSHKRAPAGVLMPSAAISPFVKLTEVLLLLSDPFFPPSLPPSIPGSDKAPLFLEKYEE